MTMYSSAPMLELLTGYYNGFARKKGWETYLSENFRITGGEMTQTEPWFGWSTYEAIIQKFPGFIPPCR